MKKVILSFFIMALVIASACTPTRKVERIDPNTTVDLSGRWNDTDSRLVADEMVGDAIIRPWRQNFENRNNRRPVVVVGLVRNRSHEHIATETFIKDIERAFINGGHLRLVQAGERREELRAERADQQNHASPETIKRWGRELGADYIMQGTLNAIHDGFGKHSTVTYQVNLELTDLETNEIVWMGDKKIKKAIKN